MIGMNFFEKRIMKQITADPANPRTDNAKQKRVELHMHTKMSEMDGVCSAAVLVKQAFVWGHGAVAVSDHGNVQAFPEVMDTVEQIRTGGGNIKPIYGMEGYFVDDSLPDSDFKELPLYHITILVKNKIGLKNLYRLVSLSNLNYFYKKPRIPLSELQKHRKGLLIGSACAEGELFRAILDGRSQEEIDAISEKYDYFEIQPAASDLYKSVNKKITELADKHGKLCAATGDVHFKDKKDKIVREIILNARGGTDESGQAPMFFRTTDEMLSEFGYLGAEKAFEVVITNTNAIADTIDADIRPIPKGAFTPSFPGTEEEFSRICWENAHARYGESLPVIVENRLKRELELIAKFGFSAYYMTAKRLVECSESNGYSVGSRGSVGSMLTAFLSGITDIDPLPPHYICPKCRHTEFITDGSVNSGFDLSRKNCTECGCDMIRSGHDIPFEMFVGFNGWKIPNIDLDFSPEVIENVKQSVRELFGEDHVFTIGIVTTVQPKTARGYVGKYLAERGITCDGADTERLANGCMYVKRTTSFHPGGLVIIPGEYDVCDFTPVDRPIGFGGILPTHFDRSDLCDTLPIIDVLEDDTPTLFKRLEDMTGVKISDIPVDDSEVLRLFSENKTQGIPDFDTERAKQIMLEADPKTFSEIVKVFGLKQGRNAWDGNARELIKNGVCTISDVIATREDIMLYLTRKGFSPIEAYNITEIIRNGAASNMFDDELRREFEEHSVPEWFFESCKKIVYLLPKAHAVARVAAAVRLAWFKLYFPSEFYAVVLENRTIDLPLDTIMRGKSAVDRKISTLRKKPERSGREEAALMVLPLVSELMSRGIEILPVDILSSEAVAYSVENGNLRLPLYSVRGCGESSVKKIKTAVDFGCTSVDEIQKRSGVSDMVIEKLEQAGVFKSIK